MRNLRSKQASATLSADPAEPEAVVYDIRRERPLQNMSIAASGTRLGCSGGADVRRVAPTLPITTTNCETAESTIRITRETQS
ncbi:hypothetical protein C8J34_103323 [Rhizobium sp. PP-F2F-G36]|nr:hypothetical protein C8J34_103323 [Rhizobium sp. PP-F2F-G36]